MAKDKPDNDPAPADPNSDRFVLDTLTGIRIGGVPLSDDLDDGDDK